MRILHTTEFYSPSVGGSQEVVRQVSQQLAKRGHTVTVATSRLQERTLRSIEGVAIEEFAVSGNSVRGLHGETDRYQRFIQAGDFDVIMNYGTQQWATDLVFPMLDRIQCGKVLAPCGFSALFDPRYATYFGRMPDAMSKYDHLIFHSNIYRDIEFARAHCLTQFTVIPNGASEQEFRHVDTSFRHRCGIEEDVPLLLTVGSHTGTKGHDLTIGAFRRARIGQSVLVVIGNTPWAGGCRLDCQRRAFLARILSFGKKRVLLLNPPRSEVVAAFHGADLFVLASSIECSPLVLFEAMASGTAFITTACGNAEEIVNWTGGGLVIPTKKKAYGTCAGDLDAATHMIEELITNLDQRRQLEESGHNAWQKRFRWEKIAEEYERVYESVVERHGQF